MKILLGVSASIAAYKAADLTSQLVKLGHEVKVVMTKHATDFITPLTFEALSHHRVAVSVMEEDQPSEIRHITWAQTADLFLVVPASANIIGKFANGIADDLLSTIALAVPATTRKIIAPAMNQEMYHHPACQRNIAQLKQDGYEIVEPRESLLACGVTGKGALATIETILNQIES